ncbi:flavin-containing monooxygenase [Leisingera sp. ANG-S5]|uniref:flavin-containing monooxygenase n=1 Tax=Leisingera sp. ANG-S5 TaxID=1577901 RepID=UPI0009E38765|nr:NAD(P)/FAD-dependent oxidoreductase [Leisingera sp. ANG-S5]
MRHERIVVVGAGPFGLALGRELRRLGFDPLILERGSAVASAWRSRHPQLQLNTHRVNSGLRGQPIPRTAGTWPALPDYVAYLDRIARQSRCRIEVNCTVQKLEHDAGTWLLKTGKGKIRADQAVLATGFDHTPVLPDWPGSSGFSGSILHSRDMGDARRYRNKSMLVAGAGNSAVDCLNVLARAETADLSVSVRTGGTTVPAELFGFPLQLTAPLLEHLPARLADGVLSGVERVAFGDLSKLGLNRYRAGAASRLKNEHVAPAVDRGFVAELKRGKIPVFPQIARFASDQVHFDDGRTLRPDFVIAATGYRSGLESIAGHLGVLDEAGRPRCCGTAVRPGLRFALMPPPLGGSLRAISKKAPVIARSIARDLN